MIYHYAMPMHNNTAQRIPGIPKTAIISAAISLVLLAAVAIALVSNRIADRAVPAILPGLDDTAFVLESAQGKISNRDLLGTPTAIFFGFTHCPDICPVTLTNLAALAREAGDNESDLRIVFISVDPERDTPQILAEYIDAVGAENTIGLAGDADAVAQVVRDFGIYARKVPLGDGDYTMDHTATVFLYGRDGKIAGTIAWSEPFDIALTKIENLLKE